MDKKLVKQLIGVAVSALLSYCVTQSLVELKKALKEKEEREKELAQAEN